MSKAIQALTERWRREAEVLRKYGCTQLADVNELHASAVLDALQADADELLTAQEAAAWSGYTTRHLRGLDLPNHGRKGSPLYRRADLPRKPGHDPERAQRDAAAVLTRMAS